MASRSTDLIFLLGAGASVQAHIPASITMINELEALLRSHGEWTGHRQLYHHVKSSIHYAAGLKGTFGKDVPFNIETLVNTLYELEKNEKHPLYPFIASWNSRFVGLAEPDFSNIKTFRSLILRELKKWMSPDDTSAGDYYCGLRNLQNDFTYPLHVFSLNYDLCVERIRSADFRIETGFDGYGPDSIWDWERFEQPESGPNTLPELYLYKLHGSVNWKRDPGNNLYVVEQIGNVDHDHMDIIFGRDFKLEAGDPYLFYVYQFRRLTLVSRLIIAIGYGFADDHINKILTQAMKKDASRRIVVVANCGNDEECKKKAESIAKALQIDETQVIVEQHSAASFLQQDGLYKSMLSNIASPDDTPF